MSYGALRIRLETAERALDAHLAQVESRWNRLRHVTRDAMTPGRLLGTGILAGVLVGFTEPLAKLGGGTRFVQLATSLIAFIGAVEAKAAAEDATDAADDLQGGRECRQAPGAPAATATEVTVAVDPVVAEVVRDENLQHRNVS